MSKISLNAIDKSTSRMKAQVNGVRDGVPSQQRVLWSAMFVPGLEGRRGIPYVLLAEPGTVKTSTFKWMARKANLPFWSILGSIRSPLDFMGCPMPTKMPLTEETKHLWPTGSVTTDDDFNLSSKQDFLYTHYAPAGFGVQASMAQNGVILFDEANNMPPAVQSSMLRVLFEGVIGELELPPGIRMFLATNSIEDAAGGWDISPAMANRLGWLEWEGSSVERFSAYLSSSRGRGSQAVKVDPIDFQEEERQVDDRWDDAWMKASMLVTGFLKAKPGNFHAKPKPGAKGKAWPSSRTWDFATHALAGSFIYDLNDVERKMAVEAYIGASYNEFYTYARDADLPDPGAFLDGQDTFVHNKGRLDRTAAVLSGCLATVLPEGSVNRDARVKALWNFIANLPDDATDIASPQVSAMAGADLMMGNHQAYKVLAKHDAIFDATGGAV